MIFVPSQLSKPLARSSPNALPTAPPRDANLPKPKNLRAIPVWMPVFKSFLNCSGSSILNFSGGIFSKRLSTAVWAKLVSAVVAKPNLSALPATLPRAIFDPIPPNTPASAVEAKPKSLSPKSPCAKFPVALLGCLFAAAAIVRWIPFFFSLITSSLSF